MDEEASHGSFGGCGMVRSQTIEDPGVGRCFPVGKPISTKLPPELLGDVLQVWNFFWRFHKLFGLQEPLAFDALAEELVSSWPEGVNLLEKFRRECVERKNLLSFGPRSINKVLSEAQMSMLKVLISEIQTKAAAVFDPNCDNNLKQKHGRHRDRQMKIDMPPVNELTWPELARRYALVALSIKGVLDSAELTTSVFRCLYGDGGLLCGSLTGVAGVEADAQVLATAMKKIFGSLKGSKDYLPIPDADSDEKDCKKIAGGEDIPSWAQELIPVLNLPTNVGSRIRNCVNASLGKGPPGWAKERLEKSISKEIYKGNASGPTKNVVRGVLDEVYKNVSEQNSAGGNGRTKIISLSDIILKQCRIVLRQTAAADERQVFCNLAGGRLTHHDNFDHGLIGYPAMVSRPLDFRTIDIRLAAGSYGGSHEAFLEDVRAVWSNIRIAFGHKPDLVQLAETLSCNFESLYKKEVVAAYRSLKSYTRLKLPTNILVEEIKKLVVSSNNIPEAPWDEGICKVCGIDGDDQRVLLCDVCDAEYHTYCLDPPLARVPQGKWYCPKCVASNDINQPASTERVTSSQRSNSNPEFMQFQANFTAHLANTLAKVEYWMLCPHEKTLLLKFLCDEILTSDSIHEHLQECERSYHAMGRELHSLSVKLKALKHREDVLREEIQLQNAIMKLETELKKNSLRSECLGVDSAHRVYWNRESSKHPCIIVEQVFPDCAPGCSSKNPASSGGSDAECLNLRHVEGYRVSHSNLVCFDSDAMIKKIIDFLNDEDPSEQQLKEAILLRHIQDPFRFDGKDHHESEVPILKPTGSFPSLNPLMTKAFVLLEHKYGCYAAETPSPLKKQAEMGKAAAEGNLWRCECLEPILPMNHHCLSCHRTFFTDIELNKHHKAQCIVERSKHREDEDSQAQIHASDFDVKDCDAAESSSKPVSYLPTDVLRQLQINLLDMDAAIPKEAVRSSKACSERRCRWRAFVKSASTIYEMVLASIAFEDMIKSEYLDEKWSYWSSLSAATKISTSSSLALRIYSLDAAILYERTPSIFDGPKRKSRSNAKNTQNDPGK